MLQVRLTKLKLVNKPKLNIFRTTILISLFQTSFKSIANFVEEDVFDITVVLNFKFKILTNRHGNIPLPNYSSETKWIRSGEVEILYDRNAWNGSV